MASDDILFNSGSLWFTEDGDLDWSLMLSGDTNETKTNQITKFSSISYGY